MATTNNKTYENLIYEVSDDGVATVTLNRPERRNALDYGLLHDLEDAFDAVEKDDQVRVLVLTGAGAAFCAGYDLTPNQARPTYSATERWDRTHWQAKLVVRPWSLRVPVVAAVDGPAVAAGNVLAMSCDLVIASERAQFGEPEVRHVAHSPYTLLPFVTANRHLRWLYYTGDFIDAQTAERWNLVNKVVPNGQALAEAAKLAQRLAKVPPFALQMMKRSITATYDAQGFTEAQKDHLMLRMIEGLTPDVPERERLSKVRMEQGMRAFLEARDGPFRE
jgi:enoyl-CoA hydratase/carnithine racemase